MCTTFLTYKLVSLLQDQKAGHVKFVDYPNLIRLNPNIPWKTRGNAALVVRLKSNLSPEELFRLCRTLVRKYAKSDKANSGLLIHVGDTVPSAVREFSDRALCSVLSIKEARRLIEKYGILSFGLRSEQGLIGALAGIGNLLERDHTYELIAYRKNTLIPRRVDKQKIIIMSEKTFPNTFNSYDSESDRVLISPHGPDPVLVGIRGETPAAVKRAFSMIQPVGDILGWMIFRTNQGTGEHLRNYLDLRKLKTYTSGIVRGSVISKPCVEKGGHVFFSVTNEDGQIACACYEPTGSFRLHALKLLPGDEIEVGGGVRRATSKHSIVLNLEYLLPLNLRPSYLVRNPKCENCGATLGSAGKEQGYRCPKCCIIFKRLEKIRIESKRKLEPHIYLPQIKAHRHLTKPLQRFTLTKSSLVGIRLVDDWIRHF